jgi:hypothetical protein
MLDSAEHVYNMGRAAAQKRIDFERKNPIAATFDSLNNIVIPAGLPPFLTIIFMNGFTAAVMEMRDYWKLAN